MRKQPQQPRGRPPHDDLLTPAEWRVLHAVQHRLANVEIARRMGVSSNAIKYHLRNIREKTRLAQRSALRGYFQLPRDTSRNEETCHDDHQGLRHDRTGRTHRQRH